MIAQIRKITTIVRHVTLATRPPYFLVLLFLSWMHSELFQNQKSVQVWSLKMRLISQPSYRFNREQAFSVALFGCLVRWKDRESQIINFHSSVWISRSTLLIGACPAFKIIFILSKFGPQDFVLSNQIQTANEYRTGFSWKHTLKFVHISVAPSLPSRCFKRADFEGASVKFAVIEGPVYTIFTVCIKVSVFLMHWKTPLRKNTL